MAEMICRYSGNKSSKAPGGAPSENSRRLVYVFPVDGYMPIGFRSVLGKREAIRAPRVVLKNHLLLTIGVDLITN